MTCGVVSLAYALWAGQHTVEAPAFLTGTVSFSAAAHTSSPTSSVDGGPVSVTLPGSVVSQVLDRTDAEPLLWEFRVSGWADGIAGLEYTVDVTAQRRDDGTEIPLDAGVVEPGTVLALTTAVVYPAPASEGCAPAPPAPHPGGSAPHRQVHVLDLAPDGSSTPATTHTLQRAGEREPGGVTQRWCVALRLDEASGYRSTATVTGRGAHGTWSRDTDDWDTRFSPASGPEPDVVLTLTPSVTSQRTEPDHRITTERKPDA